MLMRVQRSVQANAAGTAISVKARPSDHRANAEQRDVAGPGRWLAACSTAGTRSATEPAMPCTSLHRAQAGPSEQTGRRRRANLRKKPISGPTKPIPRKDETRFALRRSQPETLGPAGYHNGQQWSSIMSAIISLIYHAYCEARLAEIHKVGG